MSVVLPPGGAPPLLQFDAAYAARFMTAVYRRPPLRLYGAFASDSPVSPESR